VAHLNWGLGLLSFLPWGSGWGGQARLRERLWPGAVGKEWGGPGKGRKKRPFPKAPGVNGGKVAGWILPRCPLPLLRMPHLTGPRLLQSIRTLTQWRKRSANSQRS